MGKESPQNVESALYKLCSLYSVLRVKPREKDHSLLGKTDYTSRQDEASLQSRDFLLSAK